MNARGTEVVPMNERHSLQFDDRPGKVQACEERREGKHLKEKTLKKSGRD